MSLISIFIPTKDYSDGLIRLLEFLQENKSYLKIFISDDFSNSETKNHVKKLKFTNLIYYQNIKKFGVAYNWNKLPKECNPKYLMFVRHDD
jgi:glycosyltransferase involved in cell wall biosynthesis